MTRAEGVEAARLRRDHVRALGREVTVDEIKARARDQLAVDGVQGISLRGIGRAMGLTASALYRYFPSRDDLVTALIVDGYHAVADAMVERAGRARPGDFRAQFLAVATAFRQWATAHPAEFGLLFGTPLTGYSAPPDATRGAAFRTYGVLTAPIAAAHRAGVLSPPHELRIDEVYRSQLQAVSDRGGFDVPPPVVAAYLHAWTILQGQVTLGVFGHLRPGFGDGDAVFAAEIDALADRLGLPEVGAADA